jgi:DNA-binding XRE family transcriptional regulator
MKDSVFNAIDDIGRDYIIVPRKLLLQLLGQEETKPNEEMKLNIDDPGLYMKIRTIRKKHKISQANLAAKAHLKQPDISSFENGDDGFSSERRGRIIESLELLVKGKA